MAAWHHTKPVSTHELPCHDDLITSSFTSEEAGTDSLRDVPVITQLRGLGEGTGVNALNKSEAKASTGMQSNPLATDRRDRWLST